MRFNLKKWKPHLDRLREFIAEAKRQSAAHDTAASAASLARELGELAELHQAGALTADEFAEAKTRLLARGRGS
jgi:hypothetical protein